MTQQELDRLIKLLEETPRTIERLVKDLKDDDLRWKPSAREFSILENVCHLRDIEHDGYMARIDKILSEENPFLPDIDGNKIAEERSYNAQELDASLRAFAGARKDNVRTIKHVSLDQLNRTADFENAGAITLARLLLMMREHDQDHIKELTDLRERLASR